MKYILGINLPLKAKAHETGVALIDETGKILFAMSEERLSRVKFDGDFPERSIQEMFKTTGISPQDIDLVAVPTLTSFQKFVRFGQFFLRERLFWLLSPKTWRELLRIGRLAIATETTKQPLQQSFTPPI